MGKNAILIFCLFLVSCAKIGTASSENTPANSNKTAPSASVSEKEILLKPVVPGVRLSSKQQKYLDKALPPTVRGILEKAEKFEVLAEVRGERESDGEARTFEPSRIVKVTDEKDKKETLEAFYPDAAREDSPAACYEPRHAIRATYQGKTVEVEICFSCSRFVVKSEFGKFDGTIARENRKSEDFFNRIIENKSIEIKK